MYLRCYRRTKNGKMCSAWGTRLWGEPARNPTIAVVQMGTLINPELFDPIAHQWVKQAQPWIIFPQGATLFETQPDDPRAMLRLWHEKYISKTK